MSDYETKPNTGSLFRNEKKTTDQHPGAKGSALIDGKEYWVSAWTNVVKGGEKKGEKYQSLKFERKESQARPTNAMRPATYGAEEDDQGPPF